MKRFLLLSLPLLVLTMALFHFALDTLGLGDGSVRAARLGADAATVSALPPWAVLATWCLEAFALTALFLLVHGRAGQVGQASQAGSTWSTGLLASWIAWVFRGPLLVVAVVGAGLRPGPWWSMALAWWVLYSLCGLLMGALAQASGLQA
ncbi:MAG TPA: hypothetical protein VGQ28_08925 [Thermoanaerobaculia bacterium]|nr:hypothetical protein [Thermoanaerobaculia bacterium]